MVVTLVEMVSNCVLNISGCYVIQVALEPVHETDHMGTNSLPFVHY